MKTITQLFDEALEKKRERKWECIYVMVDLHGVILPSSYHLKNDLVFTNDYAKIALQTLTVVDDVKLILWTSSYPKEIDEVLAWLDKQKIYFDYVNRNPLEKNTKYADFTEKPYFNVLLDDKAGFDPSVDWEELVLYFTKP